jgi:hypothetical protein
MKKEILISIGITFLFIGVGFQPAFANVSLSSDSSELEEIIFQICKTDSITNHSIMITQKQSDELEDLISNFKEKIDVADTFEQTVVIYQDMIESLDRIDLLPKDVNVKKAEEIVIGGNKKIFDAISTPFIPKGLDLGINNNSLCLLSGDTTETIILGPATITSAILFFLIVGLLIDLSFKSKLYFLLNLLVEPTMIVGLIITILTVFFPLKTFNIIGYGRLTDHEWQIPIYSPAKGWLNTFGIFGKKTWNGLFYGQYKPFPYPFNNLFYTGTIGFTGFNILRFIDDDLRCFSLGIAISVKIGEKYP